MNVKVRPYRRGGWEVDIALKLPNGEKYRERVRSPAKTEAASRRWGEERASCVLANWREVLREKTSKPVSTLADFEKRFISEYARANQLKPSTIDSYQSMLTLHIVPVLGSLRLDEIGKAAEQKLKAALVEFNAKTVNNALGVLSKLLNVAVEWQVIEALPVRVKKLKVPLKPYPFYDFDEYEKIVGAAQAADARKGAVVLLGGDAGLRRGEIAALEWGDIDLRKGAEFRNGQLVVQRSLYKGKPGAPKSGKARAVPLTARLKEALSELPRALHIARVFRDDEGEPISEGTVNEWMETVLRHAGMSRSRKVHILRHTFCSHLAMRGAPAKAVQELAGHADLSTTMRYMHLSPASRQAAIDLLNAGEETKGLGDSLETKSPPPEKRREIN